MIIKLIIFISGVTIGVVIGIAIVGRAVGSRWLDDEAA